MAEPKCECAVVWPDDEEHHPECPVGRRIAELKAERDRLREAIADHNSDCRNRCDWNRTDGRCDPYLTRNRMCPDCPRDDMIELTAFAGEENQQ